MVGLLALAGALVMYSMGSWGAFRAKTVTKRHVTYLWIGFAFDVVATAMMAISARGLDLEPLSDLMHTVLAFVVMFGMAGAAIIGMQAIKAGNDAMRATLAKYILAPWALWVLMFLWGMASRGPARG
ncbi:MAG: hypothetical protein FD171_229 [Actinobacteria bacterium]|nr:MAG: hypothetical protein FD171_229 [Actinomycetota bacterium]